MSLGRGRRTHPRSGVSRRALDRETTELARELARRGSEEPAGAFHMSWWNDRAMSWAMARPEFKTQLFRFVDAFPAMNGRADVLRHMQEYFGADPATPSLMRLGVAAGGLPGAALPAAAVARRSIERMARQFIAGSTSSEASGKLADLWRAGSAFTVDLLGEKTLTAAEADRYVERVVEILTTLAHHAEGWASDARLEQDDLGPLPRVNVSIKPTALAPHLAPLTAPLGLREAADRLRTALRQARRLDAFVSLDMEHAAVKDLTLQLFRTVLTEDEFADHPAGIALQAYRRDSATDLAELIAWSAERPVPVTVRLVKGAYWDAETVESRAAGWPVPTFEDKVETDANYERCIRLLHDHHGEVRAAFASHNLRSLAYAVTYARHLGLPDNGYEIQMLYGMAEPLHGAVRSLGLRHRVYAPVGELVPGMAYLVRRLLENTSNESFVRHRFAEGRALDPLIAPPRVNHLPDPATLFPDPAPATRAEAPGPYRPEPVAEWRRPPVREAFSVSVDKVGEQELGGAVTAHIAGDDVMTGATLDSVDPADPAVVVAPSASCTAADAEKAVAAAEAAAEAWRSAPVERRAQALFDTAAWMRGRRSELAALQCFEAGKPWDQADADVCEAIDFCEYYGRRALALASTPGTRRGQEPAGSDDSGVWVQSPPGEANVLQYQGKGVAAVIAPWNFPLAIPTGMTVGALVAGNPVILKPAEQTPLTARRLIDGLLASGVPPGVVQFLPGVGEDVGAALVAHPAVAVIVFTGSRAVGLDINLQAARVVEGQRQVKRVVAEMGGKNPLIVDSDADPDEAVPAAAHSAFGFAGQKCSAAGRLIVLDAAWDTIVPRLVDYTRELVVGHPQRGEVQVGPVIDAEAHTRVGRWASEAERHGRVLLRRTDVPGRGYFVGPTIVEVEDRSSPLAREEVFGPVLAVLRARDLDDAIGLANDTDYALTAGVMSRSPTTIRRASAELRAGNVYVNRAITGSVVGRQPFGGYGLSGVGAKAGGPDYLLQFMDPRVVTENTLRQGFTPDAPS
jgi:RHH-type transcriptional regulator, proline utilization regulon repressor / proline dehydrogenase / delta 1-pyrroline-5-carboxylate dehydrogenase